MRIQLARALYYQADLYLFDDFISSLDPEIRKKIYNDVLRKKLKEKTKIVVVKDLDYL